MSVAWDLAGDLASMGQFHWASWLDLSEKRSEDGVRRGGRVTPKGKEKGMNKIQSNSSGGARIFRGSQCNEDYLLRILLHSGFGAENRFKPISSNLFEDFGQVS